MNKGLLVFFSSFLVLFFGFLLVSFYFNDDLFFEEEILVKFSISNSSGFNVGSGVLDFGSVIFGSSVKRDILISNEYDFPLKFEISCSDNLKDFLFFEESYIVLSGESKIISINLFVFENSSLGDYSGFLKIKAYRN